MGNLAWLPASAGRLSLSPLSGALLLIPAETAAAQRVTFRTDDGVTLAATWYEPSSRIGPAVILVHMLTRNRREWEAMAQRLASDGIGALAMDLRGHGESGAGPLGPPDRVDYSTMVLDLRAARRFLAQRSDVQQTRVGVAGASLGANLAALLASSDPSIASLALLSPSLDYRGLRIEAAARKVTRPMLLVAGRRRPVCVAVGPRAAEGRRRTARAADPEAGRARHRDARPRPHAGGCAGGLVSANVAMILVPCPRNPSSSVWPACFSGSSSAG